MCEAEADLPSIATVTLGGSLVRKLYAAQAAGFRQAELCDPDLEASGMAPGLVRALADAIGLSITAWQPLHGFEGGTSRQFRKRLALAHQILARAREAGAATVIVCSSFRPDAIDDDELAAAQLSELADLAVTYGLRIAYEPMSWGTHISTTRRAWQVIARAGHPALGLQLDSFHFCARGEDPRVILPVPARKIFGVQLAGAHPRPPGASLRNWSRNFRCLPGQGIWDTGPFISAVRATGYGGSWCPEVFSVRHREADPDETAAAAMASLDALGLVPSAI
jgi:4-hydroxyphenylpyruvate dioxygenase